MSFLFSGDEDRVREDDSRAEMYERLRAVEAERDQCRAALELCERESKAAIQKLVQERDDLLAEQASEPRSGQTIPQRMDSVLEEVKRLKHRIAKAMESLMAVVGTKDAIVPIEELAKRAETSIIILRTKNNQVFEALTALRHSCLRDARKQPEHSQVLNLVADQLTVILENSDREGTINHAHIFEQVVSIRDAMREMYDAANKDVVGRDFGYSQAPAWYTRALATTDALGTFLVQLDALLGKGKP